MDYQQMRKEYKNPDFKVQIFLNVLSLTDNQNPAFTVSHHGTRNVWMQFLLDIPNKVLKLYFLCLDRIPRISAYLCYCGFLSPTVRAEEIIKNLRTRHLSCLMCICSMRKMATQWENSRKIKWQGIQRYIHYSPMQQDIVSIVIATTDIFSSSIPTDNISSWQLVLQDQNQLKNANSW